MYYPASRSMGFSLLQPTLSLWFQALESSGPITFAVKEKCSQVPSICPSLQDGKFRLSFVEFIVGLDELISSRFVGSHSCSQLLCSWTYIFDFIIFTVWMNAYKCIYHYGRHTAKPGKHTMKVLARNRDWRFLIFSFADSTLADVGSVFDTYL